MRTRRLLFAFFLYVFGFIVTQAKDRDDLITEQITIKCDTAGTLLRLIDDSIKYKITKLKVVGKINTYDLLFLCSLNGGTTSWKGNNVIPQDTIFYGREDAALKNLDLSDAKFMDYYPYSFYNKETGEWVYSGDFAPGWPPIQDDNYSFIEGYNNESFWYNKDDLRNNMWSSMFYGSEPATWPNLEEFKFPSNIKSIRFGAFLHSSLGSEIDIPQGVEYLETMAFAGAFSSSRRVNIPSSVKYIANDCFFMVWGDVYVNWEYPIYVDYLGVNFKGLMAEPTASLHVPMGTYHNYSEDPIWGTSFTSINEVWLTGVDDMTYTKAHTETSRYTLDGQKINKPTKGLNIIKYNDGSVKKVLVK